MTTTTTTTRERVLAEVLSGVAFELQTVMLTIDLDSRNACVDGNQEWLNDYSAEGLLDLYKAIERVTALAQSKAEQYEALAERSEW